MKAHRGVDARVHIFTATALGRGRVTSPTLGRLYLRGKMMMMMMMMHRSGPLRAPGIIGTYLCPLYPCLYIGWLIIVGRT